MELKEIADLLRAEPGTKLRLKKLPTNGSDLKPLRLFSKAELKNRSKESIRKNLEDLNHAQELLYANDTWSVLIIFQAMDAGGKDGMIKHVMSGLNPQGCQVASFKRPSDEELDHNFLWRCQRHLPERGRLGIFNRSYYEETLIVRVHPELLARQKLPCVGKGDIVWRERWEDINNFEKHLTRNGTLILKFFLNVSKAEQKKRFLERLTKPEKHWKFNASDLYERNFWKKYMQAYEETISATSTRHAPWYVIPADNKWVARAAVSAIITHSIQALGLEPAKVSAEQIKALAKARQELLSAGRNTAVKPRKK